MQIKNQHFIKASTAFLAEGRKTLGLRLGIVSHIHDGKYDIVMVDDASKVFQSGDTYELEATYCRDVYKLGKSIALTEIDGIRGLKRHPLYMDFALEAYISAPIFFNNSVWGTINFSSLILRKEKFSSRDVSLVELYAEQLSELLIGEATETIA